MITSPLSPNDLFLDPVGGALGEMSDEEALSMLDNPKADHALAQAAIDRAMAGGMTEEQAQRLYGIN